MATKSHTSTLRQRKALFFSLAVGLLCTQFALAQDIHFTQFFTNPLSLNPAQTGYLNGNYRVGLNAKLQWPWAISPQVYNYHSETPYVDFSFGEKKIRTGWMGIGFHFLNDQAGDGRLTYRRFGLSYAYHQALDNNQRYVLSAGVGLQYVVRSVDFAKFYFNNQWVEDEGFNTSLNNNEPIVREQFNMWDLNAGLNFGAQISDAVKLDVGFSLLHINRPKHSFFDANERLGFRYQANAAVSYTINERFSINGDVYYTHQKKASEILFGARMGYGIYNGRKGKAEHVLIAGMYYRVKDALSPLVGYQFRQTRILFNYDVTLSKLARPSKANGGPEISIVHVGAWERSFNGKKVHCPRF
jgi:type IX secretion system PorP/SprF family membrane protein